MPKAARRPTTTNRHKMVDCEHCKKTMRSDTLKRHQKTCKKAPGNDGEERRGTNKKGRNFFLTWQEPVKYIAEQLDQMDEIQSFIICDEKGAGQEDHDHSHAVIILKEEFAMSYERFGSWWDNYELPKYGDIEACKKVRDSVKYCSKEDFECHLKNIDHDWLSVLKLAWCYAQKTDKLNPVSYPYCRLIPGDQRKFREFFNEFIYRQKVERSRNALKDCELFRWQQKALDQLRAQGNREVFWVYDTEGNVGKTFLGQYCQANLDCIVMENGSKKDLSYGTFIFLNA